MLLKHQSVKMTKFSISLITLFFVITHGTPEECRCVRKENCKKFGTLNPHEQEAWKFNYPCAMPHGQEDGRNFGRFPASGGDYVCCPNAPAASEDDQCAITSIPPEPETGCCGREASDTDNKFGTRPHVTPRRPPQQQPDISNKLDNPTYAAWPRYRNPHSWRWEGSESDAEIHDTYDENHEIHHEIHKRDVEIHEREEVFIEGHISGGRDTKLAQFPWAVHLKLIFEYGLQNKSLNCGGSLISSRYVLTAAHCFFDPPGNYLGAEVFLAEYDKRTIQDCTKVQGHGKKCVKNVVIIAEKKITHPEYCHTRKQNDIALIRLKENAPYTNYIRPICLPSMNVDNSEFSNVRLAITGWGDNGPHRPGGSVIKQFTVVHLISPKICQRYYNSGLSSGQLCAKGYDGEDICRGDSGGPLMMVHRGQYQLVGVASGKRTGSPCGSKVPSVYINVYHYLHCERIVRSQ